MKQPLTFTFRLTYWIVGAYQRTCTAIDYASRAEAAAELSRIYAQGWAVEASRYFPASGAHLPL